MLAALEKSPGVDRKFSIANSPWFNGTYHYERMMREVVRTLKAMIREERRSTQNCVELVPAVQCGFNTVFRERCGFTPYHVMFGRALRTALFTLASSIGHDLQVDVLDDKALRNEVQSVVEVQSQLHKEVLDKVKANRSKQHATTSGGNLPNFNVGEYVLEARVRCSASMPKLLMTWTGPWRVVVAQRPHLFGVQKSYQGSFETSLLLGRFSTRMSLSRSCLLYTSPSPRD